MAVQNWTSGFEGTPAGSDSPAQGDERIRELKETVRAVVAKEHELDPTAGDVIADQGWHKAGSAKAYVQSTAPTTRPDGTTSLDADDEGRLWIDSDDTKLGYWDGASWVNIDVADQGLNTTDDVVFNSVTTTTTSSDVFEGPHKLVNVVNSTSESTVFTALSTVMDVGDKLIVRGYLRRTTDSFLVVTYAERTTTSEILIYGLRVDTNTDSVSLDEEVLVSGGSTTWNQIRIGW